MASQSWAFLPPIDHYSSHPIAQLRLKGLGFFEPSSRWICVTQNNQQGQIEPTAHELHTVIPGCVESWASGPDFNVPPDDGICLLGYCNGEVAVYDHDSLTVTNLSNNLRRTFDIQNDFFFMLKGQRLICDPSTHRWHVSTFRIGDWGLESTAISQIAPNGVLEVAVAGGINTTFALIHDSHFYAYTNAETPTWCTHGPVIRKIHTTTGEMSEYHLAEGAHTMHMDHPEGVHNCRSHLDGMFERYDQLYFTVRWWTDNMKSGTVFKVFRIVFNQETYTVVLARTFPEQGIFRSNLLKSHDFHCCGNNVMIMENARLHCETRPSTKTYFAMFDPHPTTLAHTARMAVARNPECRNDPQYDIFNERFGLTTFV